MVPQYLGPLIATTISFSIIAFLLRLKDVKRPVVRDIFIAILVAWILVNASVAFSRTFLSAPTTILAVKFNITMGIISGLLVTLLIMIRAEYPHVNTLKTL